MSLLRDCSQRGWRGARDSRYINVNRDRVDPSPTDGGKGRTTKAPRTRPSRWSGSRQRQAAHRGLQQLRGPRRADRDPRQDQRRHPWRHVALCGGIVGWRRRGACSSGAAGDQNQMYFNQTYELRQIRIADYAKRGEDISNAMPPGGQGLDRNNPRVQVLMKQQEQMTVTMGQMLGEEVLHVMREPWKSRRPMRRCAGRKQAHLSGPPADRLGTRGVPRRICRCGRGVHPPGGPAPWRCVHRGGGWRGLQRHRPAPETRVTFQAHNDVDSDKRSAPQGTFPPTTPLAAMSSRFWRPG